MQRLIDTLSGLFSRASRPAVGATLKEDGHTSDGSYPYRAPTDKEKRLRKGIETLLGEARETSVSTLIAELGSPDQITDLSRAFTGMSMDEDNMLMQYRQHLSHRLVWFIRKDEASSTNLTDIWFAAYVDKNSDAVLKVLQHGLA